MSDQEGRDWSSDVCSSDLDALVPAYVIFIASNGTEMTIRKYGTTGAPSTNNLDDSDFENNTSFNFSIRYRVA